MRTRLVTLLVVTAACSSGYALLKAKDLPEDDFAAAREAEQRSEQLEKALSEPAAGGAPPGCSRVCELVGQICELSRNICAISDRHAGDRELAGRCSSGEQRCHRSRERIPPGCSCASP